MSQQLRHLTSQVTALLLASLMAVSAQEPRQQRVTFGRGASSATVKGAVSGTATADYLVRASAGQTMHVTLKTNNNSNYFNVLPPGSDAAIAIGSIVGPDWSGTLPATGDYRIRVYLMPNAARRNQSASYTLTIAVTGSTDAKVSGTPYHATGKVPCSVGTDPKGSAQCSFGVIRRGQDQAEVHLAQPGFVVTLHKEHVRVLHFAGDRVTSADAKEKVTAQKHGDTWSVAVNDFEFYEIPDAAIVGG